MSKSKNVLDFKINVPVFVSKRERIEPLFEVNFQTLITDATKAIDRYNTLQDFIVLNKRNKLSKRQIGRIEYKQCEIGGRPILLLNVCAYAINKSGEHIKADQIVSVEPSDKIGDSTNYFLLLPQISGNAERMYNWLALVYDDPTRESEEIISIIKAIMDKVLGRPVQNIKLPTLLQELKDKSPEITLNLSAVSFTENSHNDKFSVYQVQGRSVIKEEFKYSGMPLEKIEELIQEKFDNRFKRKVLKFLVGRKEYKINQEIANFKTGANLLVEQCFNFEEIYSTTEFHKIHHEDFILKTMTRVLDKYFRNGEL